MKIFRDLVAGASKAVMTQQEIDRIEDTTTSIKILSVATAVFGAISLAAGISLAASVVALPAGIACVVISLALFVLSRDSFVAANNWNQAQYGARSESTGSLLQGTLIGKIPGIGPFINQLIES